MSKVPLYFGCLYRAGHHLFRLDEGQLASAGFGGEGLDWVRQLDGVLPPRGPQEEGEATLSYVHGYAILAFWDRSMDERNGSSSMFLFPWWSEKLDFNDTLRLAQETFPMVFERFKFEVTQYVDIGDA